MWVDSGFLNLSWQSSSDAVNERYIFCSGSVGYRQMLMQSLRCASPLEVLVEPQSCVHSISQHLVTALQCLGVFMSFLCYVSHYGSTVEY